MLSDAGNHVATAYGVMRWKMPTDEPGHIFVLIDPAGLPGSVTTGRSSTAA